MDSNMEVWLESIAVKDLGPISKQTINLGRFNLIYGHNETGKTFLVEFLLQSLFRKSSDWKLRDLPGQGKISVQGLGDKPVEFTPGTRQKLEDYWEESELGLPTNMARLLVVKGGELELAESKAGLDRNVLKTIFSGEILLDKILSGIKTTVQDSYIEDGEIVGNRFGIIKSREETFDRLEQVDELLDRVDKRYSRGLIRSLELQEKELSTKVEEQRRAKRYKAYNLNARIESLKKKRDQLDDEDINELGQVIRDYRNAEKDLNTKQEELEKLEKLEDATDNYEWVEKAVTVWQSMQLKRMGTPHWIFVVLGAVSILGGFVAEIFQYRLPAIIAFVLGLFLSAYYIWKLRNYAHSAPEAEERVNIQSEFRERFNEPLTNLATLQAKEKALQKDHFRSQALTGDIEQLQNDLGKHSSDIERLFISLHGSTLSADEWGSSLKMIKDRRNSLDKNLRDLELKLSGLNVDESDYISEAVEISYSAEKLKGLEEQSGLIRNDIEGTKKDLENLKQAVCDETGDAIGEEWPVILQHLRDRKLELEREHRRVKAEIIAKIGVVEVLKEVKKEEEEKIQRGLQEEAVRGTMKRITGSYNSLQITDDQILVSGEYGNYSMGQLSTGAKEQILLALRMGLSARLTGGKPLFLILDDAFQLSDWDRREKLVEEVIVLAKSGWQITYLCMDDHIRDLFEVAGKKNFKDDFTAHWID